MHPAQAQIRRDGCISNPTWRALHSTHRHLALTHGHAAKYPAPVAPFAALAENTAAALNDLLALLEPGETTYITGDRPLAIPSVTLRAPLTCLQMFFPADAPLPALAPLPGPDMASAIVPLTCADAPAMVALTDLAFPGYFRPRTCEMGRYYGVFDRGNLIAMGGERLCLDPLREVSGVCTHPDFRGRGYATGIMQQVMRDQRAGGNLPWLHVLAANTHAIDLYLRMGFEALREVNLHGVSRA